jgi:hypothetical protein
MMEQIPPYLDDGEPVFIKLARKSKAPKKGNSASDGPFYRVTESEIQDHVRTGGNVGRVLRDDLVAIDVDGKALLDKLDDYPETLVIESGGDGLGFHYYYRCPDWEPDQKQLRTDSGDVGSVRSGNTYCVCPPSVHDTTGNRYSVENPRNPSDVSVSRLSELVESFGGDSTANTGRRPRGVGGAVPEIPDEYPDRPADWSTLKRWLQQNGFMSEFRRTTSSDWSGLEFKLAKCLAEGGFSEPAISDGLDRLHHNSKWHNRGPDYRTRTVRKAIQSACQDPYVDFSSPADMDGDTSERRKTVESGEGRTLRRGDNMTDFNEKESALAKESNDEGSTAVKAVKVEGQDGQDEFEFVSLRKGSLRERDTADGERVLVVDIDDTDGSSVGSPDDLDVVIDALEQLREQLD